MNFMRSAFYNARKEVVGDWKSYTKSFRKKYSKKFKLYTDRA